MSTTHATALRSTVIGVGLLAAAGLPVLVGQILRPPPPRLLEHSVNPGRRGAEIHWKTDAPCFGFVELRNADGSLRRIKAAGPRVREHRVEVDRLEPGRQYRFRVGMNLGVDPDEADFSPYLPLQTVDEVSIRDVQVVDRKARQVTIRWSTDRPTDTRVSLGQTRKYTRIVEDPGQKVELDHALTIHGLRPNTTYHYRIEARQPRHPEAPTLDEDRRFVSRADQSCSGPGAPLKELAKSYVDKLTRMTPIEKSYLVRSVGQAWLTEGPTSSPDGEGFVLTAADPLETMALDVDTGSYTRSRAFLKQGRLPSPWEIRIEEFVNFFGFGQAAPVLGTFDVQTEVAPSPFTSGLQVLRVGLKAREIPEKDRRPADLVFVVDVSGSMSGPLRLPLVKKSLRLLVEQLGEGDRVALVAYGSRATVVLPPTPASDRAAILKGIDGLVIGGSTNAEQGLVTGYRVAAEMLSPGRMNRVILCSDGVANVGRTRAESILARVRRRSDAGIDLTTVGFGMRSYDDEFMEQLADRGNGVHTYVDSLAEARRIFVQALTGTLQTVARDAKVQVEFDPGKVTRYRLLGYENRRIDDEKFRDPQVDAGEVGAGHEVTALYELQLAPGASGEMAEVRVRFRDPEGGKTTELERPILHDGAVSSPAFRLALSAACLARSLRFPDKAEPDALREQARRVRDLVQAFPGDERVPELAELLERAATLLASR